MTLIYDAQQFTTYIGFFFLIFSVIGNGINILVFSRTPMYRTNPCAFYFLIGSIDNLLYLLFNIPARILSVSYGIDLTSMSRTGCKLRYYFLITPTLIAMSCSCLATIDQFLVTSKSVSIRILSDIKWAH
ncbi:hypothetical protein I4U23_022849 [Adineta vaga]|nr:hypothetical protein I4U23_022849 [Adineta vaga]